MDEAFFRFSVSVGRRVDGDSGVLRAAYIARLAAQDPLTGERREFSRGIIDVEHCQVLAPDGAEPWVYDPIECWRRHEAACRRFDAQVFREIQASLPHQLSPHGRLRASMRFARQELVSQGMTALMGLHRPHGEKADPRNFEVHFLTSLRELRRDDFGKVERSWNGLWRNSRRPARDNAVDRWREAWADILNEQLEAENLALYVVPWSNAARGRGAPAGRVPRNAFRIEAAAGGFAETEAGVAIRLRARARHARQLLAYADAAKLPGLSAIDAEVSAAQLQLSELEAKAFEGPRRAVRRRDHGQLPEEGKQSEVATSPPGGGIASERVPSAGSGSAHAGHSAGVPGARRQPGAGDADDRAGAVVGRIGGVRGTADGSFGPEPTSEPAPVLARIGAGSDAHGGGRDCLGATRGGADRRAAQPGVDGPTGRSGQAAAHLGGPAAPDRVEVGSAPGASCDKSGRPRGGDAPAKGDRAEGRQIELTSAARGLDPELAPRALAALRLRAALGTIPARLARELEASAAAVEASPMPAPRPVRAGGVPDGAASRVAGLRRIGEASLAMLRRVGRAAFALLTARPSRRAGPAPREVSAEKAPHQSRSSGPATMTPDTEVQPRTSSARGRLATTAEVFDGSLVPIGEYVVMIADAIADLAQRGRAVPEPVQETLAAAERLAAASPRSVVRAANPAMGPGAMEWVGHAERPTPARSAATARPRQVHAAGLG